MEEEEGVKWEELAVVTASQESSFPHDPLQKLREMEDIDRKRSEKLRKALAHA